MPEENFKELKNKLKIIFCGYRRINPKMISQLAELGFILVREKNHYMFDYSIGNEVIRFEIDKTPGDVRSGIKTACLIARKIKSRI